MDTQKVKVLKRCLEKNPPPVLQYSKRYSVLRRLRPWCPFKNEDSIPRIDSDETGFGPLFCSTK